MLCYGPARLIFALAITANIPTCARNEPGGGQRHAAGLSMSVPDERQARSVALERAYVHDVYEQISAATHLPGDATRARAWPKVKQFLAELEPGSLVCDVGCGNGKYLSVNPSVYKVGVDRCCRLAEVAREKDHEVMLSDNLSLPFRDESFDAVLSVAVVHHFATTERRVGALRELARVLRIGGRLIISVWAMEQRHRKFESQDVLVPWHRPQQLSTPSLELTSTTTTTTSEEEEGPPPYHAYTQTSDSDSCRSHRAGGIAAQRRRGRSKHKGRSIDPMAPSSSPSSSSLSSPNETCYSFVRRALQKLAGGKRGGSGHRPWFLDSWSSCTKDPVQGAGCQHFDCNGECECEGDVEDIQDLPIELRRLEEEHEPPQRRQTLACARRPLPGLPPPPLGHKSKSLSDILTVGQKDMVRSLSSVPSLGGDEDAAPPTAGASVSSVQDSSAASVPTAGVAGPAVTVTVGSAVGGGGSACKPRLVKQKQSVCEEEAGEEGEDPSDLRDLVKALPDFKVNPGGVRRCKNVFKQSSMNEELMSAERLREKERVRQNIQKQASLNEELIYRRHRTLDSLRDTLFSTTTAKRFQLLKNGLTNKLKNSTTGIEKVAGSSFKNGFVRILQGWKGSEVVPNNNNTGNNNHRPPPSPTPPTPPPDNKKMFNCNSGGCERPAERRHSREDGSDSSKDSSLQSDTSVDSEDSFASVIFVPKPEQQEPPSGSSTSPANLQQLSPPKSPQPTSPKVKQQPPTPPPLPKSPPKLPPTPPSPDPPPILSAAPAETAAPPEAESEGKQRLRQVQEMLRTRVNPLLPRNPGSSTRPMFPLVRRSSALSLGVRTEPLARPLPRLLSLELFNPETDDMDSDSSGVSSPDSVSSVISVLTEEPAPIDAPQTSAATDAVAAVEETQATPPPAPSPPPSTTPPQKLPKFPSPSPSVSLPEIVTPPSVASPPKASPSSLSLLEAAADVASSLEDAVDAVIQSSPRARRRKLEDPLALIQGWNSGASSRRVSPRRDDPDGETWNENCRQHLADFAEKLSEKLLEEIDQYRRQTSQGKSFLPCGFEHLDDPYLSKLSEELEDLSKLSEELQKRNSFIASLNENPGRDFLPYETLDDVKWKYQNPPQVTEKTMSPGDEKASFNKVTNAESNIEIAETVITDEARTEKNEFQSNNNRKRGGPDANIPENKAPTGEAVEDGNVDSYSRQTSADITEDLDEEDVPAPQPALRTGLSLESNSDVSDGLRTASTASLSDPAANVGSEGSSTRTSRPAAAPAATRSSSEEAAVPRLARQRALAPEPPEALPKTESCTSSLSGSTSQESLPSDSGGAITFHRYYHVFREGELDQLIERYVENLHIISSYYDHANWCVIAEKVQVWTI